MSLSLSREPSPRKSPSPDRRFARILKPTKSKTSDGNSSTGSLALTETVSETSSIRRSIDKGIAGFKDKTRKEAAAKENGRRGSTDSRRKLSRLVPKRSRKKLRDGDDDDSASEYDMGAGGGALGASARPSSQHGSKLNLPSNNASSESFTKSAASSVLTEDSDSERPSGRPELASRASHKGYLTYSSPLIAAETVDTTADNSNGTLSHLAQSPQSTEVPPVPPIPSDINSNVAQPGHTNNTKANTFPRQEEHRPTTASSSQPSIKISTFPPDRPQTPSTYITPPTPIIPRSNSPPKSDRKAANRGSLSLGGIPGKTLSAVPKDSIKHRRTRSATSTAGKNTAAAPALTPHVEEIKTPGGSVVQPSTSSGFFASVFSATQNAVSQISNSLGSQQTGGRSRSDTSSSAPTHHKASGSTAITDRTDKSSAEEDQRLVDEKKEPAVTTLGSGNLSLTHLGISDSTSDFGNMPSRSSISEEVQRSRASTQNGARASAPSATTDDASVAEAAVSAAYGSKTPSEKSVPVVTDNASTRPRSLSNLPAESTPQRSVTQTTTDTDLASLRRAGSVRSRLSGRRAKHRNGSAAGGAIAAALSASHGALANPSQRRPTGFAVANTKRNREFHKDFKSVPEEDHLIDDFSAALQRDILLQGRFYISEQHVCFASNILGWTTTLVINFDEVVAIEKKSTAMIFSNAIMVQTLHARNVFASFLNRDAAYDLLIRIWRISHPNLKVTENGTSLDESAAEKQDVPPSSDSTGDSDEDSEEDEDEDTEYHEDAASSVGRPPSVTLSEAADTVRIVSKSSPPPATSSSTQVNGNASKTPDPGAPSATAPAQDFPGPATHPITQCGDSDTHYPTLCLDTTIPAPLGKVYSVMFGPESGKVFRKFLVDDQKSQELQMEDDGKGLGENAKTASYSYIKPLSGSIGPKQTKCLVTANLDSYDLEKAVCVTNSTQTPDVPSGNVFVIKTRYCLMWGPGNSTRIIMNCACEWSGKSWLKGPIEKGANDGQQQFGKDMAAFFKNLVAVKSPTKATKSKSKGKKKKSSADLAGGDSAMDLNKSNVNAQAKGQAGGILGSVQSALGPAGDLIGPLLTPAGILSTLLALVTFLWIRQSFGARATANGLGLQGYGTAERLAAYEQLWRREENQLWEWLEDRMRFNEFSAPAQVPHYDDNLMKSMNERQVDDAIRVTEERLQSLKRKVDRGKAKQAPDRSGSDPDTPS